MPRGSKRRYCTCRSTNVDGEMISCDRCDEWYHYKCIGMTKATEPGPDEPYFCKECIKTAKKKHCLNPRCTTEARENSRYCSDDCGLEYNRIRYLKHYRSKMERLEKKHSNAYKNKMDELEKLDNQKEDTIKRIGNLRREREELVKRLTEIKEHAKVLGAEANQTKDEDMDDSADEDDDDIITSDLIKLFCSICGIEQPSDKAFKHWTSCYKKQESTFISYLTQQPKFSCETDPEPIIFCRQLVDKKRNWFCPNLENVCPQHSNFNPAEGEVCGMPLSKVPVQDYSLDGIYCLKPKKDCTTHYQWDRFVIVTKDYERAQAFLRLQKIDEEISRTQTNYNEHYGGVLGVMLHNTIEHRNEDDFEDMIEV